MDIILTLLAGFLLIIGILGSFLPVLPGVPISWVGLLVFYLAPSIPMNYWFLGITLLVTILIFVLNVAVPAMGTKRFGGSKAGMIGATIGLVVGLIAPVPFGILIGPFVGAFIGEILNKNNSRSALKAAYGSFLGLIASSVMEFLVTLAFFILFIYKVWDYKELLF